MSSHFHFCRFWVCTLAIFTMPRWIDGGQTQYQRFSFCERLRGWYKSGQSDSVYIAECQINNFIFFISVLWTFTPYYEHSYMTKSRVCLLLNVITIFIGLVNHFTYLFINWRVLNDERKNCNQSICTDCHRDDVNKFFLQLDINFWLFYNILLLDTINTYKISWVSIQKKNRHYLITYLFS